MARSDPHRPPGRHVLRFPLILIFTVFAAHSVTPQTGWESVAGGPAAGRNPLSVSVIDSLHAVVGGRGGFIARTIDGGTTWIRCYTGSTDDFGGITFTDMSTGTAVGGAQSTILRTVDGGITWRRQTNGPFGPGESFSSVSFSDSANGVIVTLDGKIFHTSNGGEEWVSASPQLLRGLLRVRLKSSYGLAVGYVGDTYRTSDGGRSWYYHSALTYPRNLRDVVLLDSLRFLVVGDEGVIRKTTDSGIFWTAVPGGTTEDLQSVLFFDNLNGIIGTGAGSIMRTSDGGASWSPPGAAPIDSIRDMAFASPRFGLCLSRSGGRIFRSGDGGAAWEDLDYSWTGGLFGICAAGPESVFAVGEGGRIAFSSDSGRNWTQQPAQTGVTLRDVVFRNSSDGWIAGDSGAVLRTTDGGGAWTPLPVPVSGDFRAIASPDAGAAIVAGEDNIILRTIDGGASWTPRQSPVFDHWQAVSFLNAVEGVAAGLNGSIIRTADGGQSWQLLHSAGSLTDIQYIDERHLYAVGTPPGDTLRGLIQSSDGGSSWTFRGMSGRKITAGSFANPAFGCVAGGEGGLLVTQDSGLTWIDRSPSAAPYHAILMAGPRAAFAAGDSGAIARMLAGGGISGRCYRDLDHDGVEDPDETGLGGRTIYLDGPFADSTLSASDGSFGFRSLPYATYTVRPGEILFWEQTAPASLTPDTLTISAGAEQGICRDIGFAGPSVRIHIPVLVRDSTSFAHRFVWWGIRPGATFGIWGADPAASGEDSIEGEFEIPPRSFAEIAGIFDARFSDPRYPLNAASDRFGEGSWTDVRSYQSPVQRDTFLLSFLPGYYFGGNYPMTLTWSAGLVANSFNGSVDLIDIHGSAIDMKAAGSVTVTDTNVQSFLVVTHSPRFPDAWLTRWRLVSLPASVGDGSVASLFPSAGSRAYSFAPGVGFVAHDTLQTNLGYWLKYPAAIDTLDFDPGARLRDTVAVSGGWNLVGSLSVPVAANSVTAGQEGVSLGYFFGYEGGYSVADSLLPGKAYWVHSSGDGSIVLDAGSPVSGGSSRSRSEYERALSRLTPIRLEDAELNSGTLYLDEAAGPGAFADLRLPPRPPDGVFDVRFGTDRLAGAVRAGKEERYPVQVSSARFPLTVTLSPGISPPVLIEYGGGIIPLTPGVPVTIPEFSGPENPGDGRPRLMTLIIRGETGLPADYALLQNYPNPFNSITLISYALPVASRVRITVYDVVGRELDVLVDGEESAGYRSLAWSAPGVASGVYFYRMETVAVADPARSYSTVKKLVLIR